MTLSRRKGDTKMRRLGRFPEAESKRSQMPDVAQMLLEKKCTSSHSLLIPDSTL